MIFSTVAGITFVERRWTRVLTNTLTYSTVQSPSWEAKWFAASQEIPRILWNPKVHYCTHKRPPPVHILCQPNPVHIPTSHLLEIHPNIIHPSTPRSPQWSLSLRLPPPRPYTPPTSKQKRIIRTKLEIRFIVSASNVRKNIAFWNIPRLCLSFFERNATCRRRRVWSIGGIILTVENRNACEKTPVPLSFCPQQNSHGLTWGRTQAFVVKSQRLSD